MLTGHVVESTKEGSLTERGSIMANDPRVVGGDHNASRREFAQRLAYVAPAILTLQVAPAYAKAASYKNQNDQGQNNNSQGDNQQ
jgi:hypothetical protein